MAVNYQQLRTFHAVASDRSITRAANRLAISQPTLSKQLKELQDRYQVQLFTGNRPPLTLTPEGEALLMKTRALFDISDEIEGLLGQTPTEEGGLLRIGTDSPPYAADLIAAFAREAPRVDFKVTIANARETNQLLMAAQVDIAIVCEPMGHNDYTYRPLYEDRLVAVLPVDLPADDIFDLAAVPEQVVLLREPTSRTRTATERLFEAHEVAPARTMEFHTREMIREAVARGLGITFMYERECPPDARLKVLPIASDHPSTRIAGYIACRTERRRHPAIRKALDIAAR
jgi:DNA-binding transcriptional LysR family regulator